MGKSQQQKGRAAEIEVCRILNDNGIQAAPGVARSYGSEPDIKGVDGFHMEIKRREQIKIGEWMSQAERDAERFGGWPCVVFRRNREKWKVVLSLDAWISLYKAWITKE